MQSRSRPFPGRWLTGSTASQAYFGAAVLFALIGAAILILVGATYRETAPIERPMPRSVRDALASLARNRAFVALSAAMMAMIVAITVLNKSVLYYFKYLLNDPEAVSLRLASMGIVSGIAIPVDAARPSVGLRAIWLLGRRAGDCRTDALRSRRRASGPGWTAFLIALQVMIVGLNFVFWAMLPNTIEYGERETGVHVEGRSSAWPPFSSASPSASPLQSSAGASRRRAMSRTCSRATETLSGMRATMVLVPMLFLLCPASRCCSTRSGGARRRAP